jgi:hypothetical protein
MIIADAVGDVAGNGYLLPAILSVIFPGLAALFVAAPGLVRAIREDEADELKALVRRAWYWLKEHDVLERLPGDMQKDMEELVRDMEEKKPERGIFGRRK